MVTLNKNKFILKKIIISKQIKEDIKFARRTEDALKRIEEGKGIKMDFDNFIKEMREL